MIRTPEFPLFVFGTFQSSRSWLRRIDAEIPGFQATKFLYL